MPRKLKIKAEIQSEIDTTIKLKEKLRAQKSSFIEKEAYNYRMIDYDATLDALYWVLGQNDRYD
jgi:hypothetical protein